MRDIGCTRRGYLLRLVALAAAAVLIAVVPAAAQDKKDETDTKPEPDKPKLHKVTKGDFRVEVKLSGVFEATKMAPISLSPKAWATLKIVKVAPHGARVKKGDVLIQLEAKKLEKALREKTDAVQLGEMALKQAVEELRVLEKSADDRLMAIKRGHKRSLEDQEHYEKIGKPLNRKATDAALKARKDSLEYTREELRQLKKMYEADELTEETEEIVLKRQQNAVQRAELAYEQAKVGYEKAVKFDLPRKAEDLILSRKARDENYKSQLLLAPLALKKKQLEVAKAKRDHAAAVEALGKLKADRGLMTVRAPMGGIVYYGQCDRGKWATGAALAPKLIPAGTITPKQVVLTVADPAELLIRCTAPEKELHRLRKDLAGKATPTGYPDRKLKVEMASFSPIPMPGGSYDVQLRVVDKSGGIFPGMTCSVALSATEKKGVLSVPAGAIHGDAKERYVWLKTPGKPQKRVVKTGKTHGGKTEILEGLAAGDEVFLQKPK